MEREQGRRQRRYSPDEMSEILDAAARLDGLGADPGDLTVDEVAEIGRELGISPDTVREVAARRESAREAEAAERVAAERAERELDEWRAMRRARRWRKWRAALARTLGLVMFFFLLDFATSNDLTWWFYPAIALGLGFTIRTFDLLFRTHASDLYPPEDDDGS